MLTRDQIRTNFQADMLRRIEAAKRVGIEAAGLMAAKQKKRKPFDVPPLFDQLRDHLALLPPSQRERVSIPALLPHLHGRWRAHPHPLHIARALKLLGYRPMRSWSERYGRGIRYWLAPDYE